MNFYDSSKNKNDINFSDSWKSKSVELAATGAILMGAGSLAVKGNAGDSLKYAKQALKQSHKGFENYIKRRSNPVTRLVYNTGKKTVNTITRQKPISNADILEQEIGKSKESFQSILESDIISEAAKRQSALEGQQKHLKDVAQKLNQKAPMLEEIDPIRIQEEVRSDLYMANQKVKDSNNWNPGQKGAGNIDNKISTFVGSAISGLGFGAGLTALHTLDKSTRQERDKKKDRSFEAAGSFLPNKDGGRNNLRKEAGYREVYDGLASLGKKVPQAAATGLGFTGVSLGTASVLNKQKEKEKANAEPNKSRIIIEFGEEGMNQEDKSNHTSMGGLGILPKNDFNKQASASGYFKNLGGRSSEKRLLGNKINDHNYQADAIDSLKGTNAKDVAKTQYGHILNEDKAFERLIEDTAFKYKGNDKQRLENINNDVAKARLATGAGVGLAGIGAGGLGLLHKKKKEGEVNE